MNSLKEGSRHAKFIDNDIDAISMIDELNEHYSMKEISIALGVHIGSLYNVKYACCGRKLYGKIKQLYIDCIQKGV